MVPFVAEVVAGTLCTDSQRACDVQNQNAPYIDRSLRLDGVPSCWRRVVGGLHHPISFLFAPLSDWYGMSYNSGVYA